MKEFLIMFGGTMLVIALITAGAMTASNKWSAHACVKRAEMMKLDAKYSAATGCMVSVGEMYVPINAIRIINGHLVIEQGDGNK